MLVPGSPPMEGNRLHTSLPSTSESESANCDLEFKSPNRGSVRDAFFSDWLPQEDSQIEMGRGLENLGNSCFLNSVLQCFMHTVPLLNKIFSDEQWTHSKCNADEFCTLCYLKELVKLSLKSDSSVLSPERIFDNLNYFSSSFQKYQQEDAHEFLQCFLDKLERSFSSKSKDRASSDTGTNTIVKEVFGGRILSKLTCYSCGHCSDTFEPSIDLSLEIDDADTLITALQSFTKLEKIEDPENKFACAGCKDKVFGEKQLSFHQTPLVAVFHLKRFKNDGEKIGKHVEFPIELELLPFTSGNSDVDLQYSLYGVVVHRGWSSTSGHYYCFIRVSQNMWYKFDDSRVEVVNEECVLSQKAYILFYTREGTPWFTSFSEAQRSTLECDISNTSPISVLESQTASPSSPEEHELPPCSNVIIGPEIRGNDDDDGFTVPQNEILSNEKDQTFEPSPGDAPSMPENQQFPNISQAKSHQFETFERISRFPSPEIYRDDPSDPCIPTYPSCLGLTPTKRGMEDENTNDMGRKQAMSLLNKRFHGSRALQLKAALMSPIGYSSLRRKKSSRTGFSHRAAFRPTISGTYR